jgi:hypothetical protein
MLVVARKAPAGAAETGLDLVGDEQDAGLVTDRPRGGEVAVGRDDDSGLPLDRLDEEGDGVLADGRAQRLRVTVGHPDEPGSEGAKAGPRQRVVREADDRGRPAMEVAGAHDDLGATRCDALALVAPLARELDRRLDRLGARVHRQNAIAAAELGQLGAEGPELVVVEGAARQRQPLELLRGSADEPRMAMTEVHRRVGRERVVVAAVLDVAHPDALATAQHDAERVVVVGAVTVLGLDRFVRVGARSHRGRQRTCASAFTSADAGLQPAAGARPMP